MSDDNTAAAATTGLVEQQFLGALKENPLPVDSLLDLLNSLNSGGDAQRLEQFALLLEDALAKAGDLEGLIRLFEMRLEWNAALAAKAAAEKKGRDAKDRKDREPSAPDFTAHIREGLNVAAHRSRLHLAFVDSIALGKPGVAPAESLRRLRVLLRCAPGVRCLDKTWGFGVIAGLDDFYRRMTIDFDRRKRHPLAFAYAAESLRLLPEDHILCQFHDNPAAFRERMKKEPGEVAVLALRSFGPMSVTHMEDVFAGNGLLAATANGTPTTAAGRRAAAEEWKSFWTAARTALKGNPNVRIPPTSKKNDPVTLLVKAVSFGDEAWFEELAADTDAPDILARASALVAKGLAGKLPERSMAILSERLQFAYKAARTRTLVRTPAMETAGDMSVSNESRFKRWREGVRQGSADMARAALLAGDLGLADVPVAEWTAEMAHPDFLCKACAKMATRDLERLVASIPDAALLEAMRSPDDGETPVETPVLAGRLADRVMEMPFALADELLPRLVRGDLSVPVRTRIADLFCSGGVSFPILLWTLRHQSEPDVATMVPPATLCAASLVALDRQCAGEDLRLHHLVARTFEDFSWLSGVMDRMDNNGRQALLDRIRANDAAWEPPVKRRIVKDILARYPDLATPAPVQEAPAEAPRLTSRRSYAAYVETLRRLVEEEIPKNAHDIDVARSYGDLRENFEYQTAKDTQRMLLQRQADLSEQIAAVTATDFESVPTDRVGMGTEVLLRFADGTEKAYSILGEWDNDESLSILPCRSRIAEALMGAAPGAAVELPPAGAGESPRPATVAEVRPLSEAVRAWMRG